VKAGFVSELFLGQTSVLAKFSDPFAEVFEELLV